MVCKRQRGLIGLFVENLHDFDTTILFTYTLSMNKYSQIIGSGGGEKIIEFVLDENEKYQFSKRIESVDKLISTLKNKNF